MPPVHPPATANSYDADYYGNSTTPKANYRWYGPGSVPHWAYPLSAWLTHYVLAPYLDIGCAFGHLVRELARAGHEAQGVDWSPYATERAVVPDRVHRADGRALPFAARAFGTVVSLDYLEHFTPDGTTAAIAEIDRVLRPGGHTVHLVGAHNPAEDVSRHLSDPTHANHEQLEWYAGRFEALGYRRAAVLEQSLNEHPAWRSTDWRGRWLAFAKPFAGPEEA